MNNIINYSNLNELNHRYQGKMVEAKLAVPRSGDAGYSEGGGGGGFGGGGGGGGKGDGQHVCKIFVGMFFFSRSLLVYIYI